MIKRYFALNKKAGLQWNPAYHLPTLCRTPHGKPFALGHSIRLMAPILIHMFTSNTFAALHTQLTLFSMQVIENDCARAELAGSDAMLSVHSSTEEVTLTAQVIQDELALSLQYNQKTFFRGTADELRALMEAMQAIKGLKGSNDLSAIWYYINQ